jgi:hypothetical protein
VQFHWISEHRAGGLCLDITIRLASASAAVKSSDLRTRYQPGANKPPSFPSHFKNNGVPTGTTSHCARVTALAYENAKMKQTKISVRGNLRISRSHPGRTQKRMTPHIRNPTELPAQRKLKTRTNKIVTYQRIPGLCESRFS